jgi:hypothetical protein
MTASEKFKQDNRVYFKLGEGKPGGWAKVCGVQGFVVIIQPEKSVMDFYEKNKPYPYSHLYVIESQLSDTEPAEPVELEIKDQEQPVVEAEDVSEVDEDEEEKDDEDENLSADD